MPGEIGNLVIKGTKITMQQPRLTGYTSDARPYEFTADTAQQDITKPDFVELQQIHAKIAMADKSIVHLWADTGHYNMKTDMLDPERQHSPRIVDRLRGAVEHGDSRRWQGQCGFQYARMGEAARRRSQRQTSGDRRQGRHAALYRRDHGAAVRQATDESGSAMRRGLWLGIFGSAALLVATAAMAQGPRPPVRGGWRPKQGSADPDRRQIARSPRPEQTGDLHGQRKGGAGRHHDDL